jgi:hypothetical protein
VQPCSVCRYPLADQQPICPECGSDPDARRAASLRRTGPRRLIIGYCILTLPSWATLFTLALGWTIARVVLRVPNVHVETGHYPILDWLASAALMLALLSFTSFLALPLLPVALLMASRWRTRLVLLLMITPVLIEIGMMRPFGGAPWRLVNWIPD